MRQPVAASTRVVQISFALIAGAAVLTLAVMLLSLEPIAGRQPAATRSYASAELQAERAAVVAELKREQVIQKIDTPGTLPRVYVLPRFFAATFDQKQTFIAVCHCWIYRIPPDRIDHSQRERTLVYDAMTNKHLGTFTSGYGLALE